MVGALKALGLELEERWEQCEMVVHGCAGRFPAQGGELFLGNAGTAMRCCVWPLKSLHHLKVMTTAFTCRKRRQEESTPNTCL